VQSGDVLSFGTFELDRSTGELRKHGLRIRLAAQPLQILLLLTDRAGELVTRDEIRQRLWSSDTFVDFDAGLSSAVRKLREAVGDAADNPRFIETIPKRGYRFIAPVDRRKRMTPDARTAFTRPRIPPRFGGAALALVVVAAVALLYGRIPVLRGRGGRPSARAVSADAYDAYLKGVASQGRGGMSGFNNAIAYFETAVGKQPDFALAYAQLGLTQLQLLYSGALAPREVVPKAEMWTRQALALDEALPEAHLTLAQIFQNYYWRWEDSDREIRRAVELDADSVTAHTQAALAFVRRGRYNEALAETELARKRDPLSFDAAMTLGSVLRAARQYSPAIAEYQRGLALNPNSARARYLLGITYVFVDQWSDALDNLEAAVRLSPRNSRFEAYLVYAYARTGRINEARSRLTAMQERARREYVSSFGLALIEDALGSKQAAMADLARAEDEHAVELAQLDQYPGFISLRGDSRYEQLMRRIGRR
jgi:DNA-binding winged helix-turn-helix (wHTH) protein/Tfp pilus assembly protein PilF